MSNSARDDLLKIHQSAISACHPAHCLPTRLPPFPERGKMIVMGAGKASSAMATALEDKYLADGLDPSTTRLTGSVATRHGYATGTRIITIEEAGHPVPDNASLNAAQTALNLATSTGPDDLLIVLLSGGCSSIWCAPLPGISLAQKQTLTKSLLASGMPILGVNTIRKHLSAIKGGGLARRAGAAPMLTFAISDVPGNIPSFIGSGPTMPDETTQAQALQYIADWNIELDDSLRRILENPANETAKPGEPLFANKPLEIIASAEDAIEAAAIKTRELGYEAKILGTTIEGEARDIARLHARETREMLKRGHPTALISGGELTVTLKGNGIGGPNQEYLLALFNELRGASGISALAVDTDGSDGGSGASDDPAGAIFSPENWQIAQNKGLNPATFLANNDSTTFFRALDGLIVSGPTHTNINDLRVILTDP